MSTVPCDVMKPAALLRQRRQRCEFQSLSDVLEWNKAQIKDVYCRAADHRDVRFVPKVGQIATKWDKYGTFSDQISVLFASQSFQIRFQYILPNKIWLFLPKRTET